MSPDRFLPPAFRIYGGGGPFVAVALHAGHAVRPEVARALALSPSERMNKRVYRGGGLVKDRLYLKGLSRLLRYLDSLRDGASVLDLVSKEEKWKSASS